uniref:CCHC-type domain-containing protein n=1 Tax=Nothobranchius furzeri TaxID=105023 RepID=A0A8C6P718_NOTFU
MDSAGSDSVLGALGAQRKRLLQQEQQMSLLCQEMGQLNDQHDQFATSVSDQLSYPVEKVQRLQTSSTQPPEKDYLPQPQSIEVEVTPGTHSASPGLSVHLARFERFSGDSGDCQAFLTQCSLHFELQPFSFPTERAKIAFLTSHLSGRVEAWATSEWERNSDICKSLDHFTKRFTQIFQYTRPGREASRALCQLQQKRRHVADYAIEFHTLAAACDWNQSALFDAFLSGLSSELKDMLAPLDLPEDLDSLIALPIKIDKRLTDRQRERGFAFPSPLDRWRRGAANSGPSWHASAPESSLNVSSASPSSSEEPMEIGRAHLSPEEHQCCFREGLCLYCGQLGHQVSNCPVNKKGLLRKFSLVSCTSFSNGFQHASTTVQLSTPEKTVELVVLIDSGADANLMDAQFARQLDLEFLPLERPLQAVVLNGHPLCYVSSQTPPVKVTFADNHSEMIKFFLSDFPQHLVILGYPWLVRHNPNKDWSSGSILSWNCNCLQSTPGSAPLSQVLGVLPDCDSDFPDLSRVPSCYHDLKEVFSKSRATSLPPHRPYDCAIDLLPGTTPPKGRLYPLSLPERQAMRDYIDTALRAGIIRESSSPAGVGFFLCG